MKHYQIRKRVFCDLIGGYCTDEHDITVAVTPDCKSCSVYGEWKESGLLPVEYDELKRKEFYDEYISKSNTSEPCAGGRANA